MTDDSPLISIVIPTYNYASLLPRAVESVLSQENIEFELLVIDDGSVDNTLEVLERLRGKHSNSFIYRSQENKGLAATRNRGVAESRGKYILFLDADDILCDGVLQQISETLLKASEPAMIIGGYYSNWDGLISKRICRNLRQKRGERLEDYLLTKRLVIVPSATFVARTVFEEVAFDEGVTSSEDIPFFAGLLAKFDDIQLLDFPIAEMTRHNDSMRNDFSRAEHGFEPLKEALKCSLSEEFEAYVGSFHTKRLLSLSRLAFLSAEPKKGRAYYLQALRRDWKVLFKWGYLRKFLKGLFF